jgi:hypothetical protein
MDKKWGFLVIAGALFGLFLLLRKPAIGAPYADYGDYEPDSGVIKLRTPRRQGENRREDEAIGKRYRNSETWNIQWSDDGMPIKVEIHRDAVQT